MAAHSSGAQFHHERVGDGGVGAAVPAKSLHHDLQTGEERPQRVHDHAGRPLSHRQSSRTQPSAFALDVRRKLWQVGDTYAQRRALSPLSVKTKDHKPGEFGPDIGVRIRISDLDDLRSLVETCLSKDTSTIKLSCKIRSVFAEIWAKLFKMRYLAVWKNHSIIPSVPDPDVDDFQQLTSSLSNA